MAAFYYNWPTFHQLHRQTTVPPPPEQLQLPLHEDFTLSDTIPFLSTTNLPIHNPPLKYPILSTTQQPPQSPLPLPDLSQSHEFYDYSVPFVPNLCNYGDFIMDPGWSQMQVKLPETYDGGGGWLGYNVNEGEGRIVNAKEMNIGDGGRRLSAQSTAARVRRRKISEKTSELGKLIPGGHRMTTAEMFQAGFKYIKFLQAQVAVLKLMHSSPGVGAELEALVTSPSVQEKLYAAGKCIVTQTLGKILADEDHGTYN